MPSETETGAMLLAEHGLYVLRVHHPVFSESVRCSCSKGGRCPAIGKHPVDQGWGKSATKDPEILNQWFSGSRWNMGIVLGLGHGIDVESAVIDIENDTEEGGLIAEEKLSDHPTVSWTSNKSTHRLYRWHPGLPDVANLTINGLEVRIGGAGKETQSIAPPSQHENGKFYDWVPGRKLGEIEIAELPEHFVEWVNANYTEQQSKGPGLGTHAAFRTIGEKVTSPGRNNAMLRFANGVWREIWQIHGINSFDEPEVESNVLSRLLGANLLTCEPPLPTAEIETIFINSRNFMFGELQKEAAQKRQSVMELTNPESTDDGDSETGDRTFGSFLSAISVKLESDPRFDPADEMPDRIDQWMCDWKLSYLKMTDRGTHLLKLCDTEIYLTEAELDRPLTVARKVYQATNGRIRLDRTFPYWSWREMWLGRSGKSEKSKKNGITRGLREWIENTAETQESGENGLMGMVSETISMLIGATEQIAKAWQNRPPIEMQDIELQDRMKVGPQNALIMQWQEGDSNSGVYLWKNDLWEIILLAEVSRVLANNWGRNQQVGSKELSDVMQQLGYQKKEFKRGRVQGRRWIRKVQDDVDEGRE